MGIPPEMYLVIPETAVRIPPEMYLVLPQAAMRIPPEVHLVLPRAVTSDQSPSIGCSEAQDVMSKAGVAAGPADLCSRAENTEADWRKAHSVVGK